MSEINVCFGCAPKGAQTEGSTEGGAEGSAEGSTEARGGAQSTEKNEKTPPTFGPRSILGYFKNNSGHSVFFIYHSLRTEVKMAA